MKTTFQEGRISPLRVLLLVASLAGMLSAPLAHAMSSYASAWRAHYSTSQSFNNASCQLCHASTTQYLNPYGRSICTTSGANITSRIQAVENLNADSDPTGSDNLTEINAGTQPGWTPGNVNATYNRTDCSPTGLVQAPPSSVAGDLDPPVGNQAPIADAQGPYTGTVNVSLAFDGSASSDPDGSITVYTWDFGDGATGSGISPSHTYSRVGTFTVVLTVTDDAGATSSATTSATIGLGNQPPVANVNGPYSGMVGVAVNFNSSGTSDPDGSIVSYAWDFGDGSVGNGAAPTHVYAAAGVYNVTLTVMDDAGATDSAATTAQIVDQPVNQPPVSDAGGPYTGTAGVAVAFDGSASSDPDGTITAYAWDFGDGNTGSGVGAGHIYATSGNFTVTLTVTDDAGATASAVTTATIDGVNQPPLADAGGPYSGTVDASLAFNGSGSNDPDGTIVSYTWDFGDGTAGTGVMPTHRYATAGSYTVTLTVTDDAGAVDSATTTVTIGAGNLPPIADAGGPYSVTVGSAVAFDASGSTDPDGTLVAYTWDFGDGNTGTGQTVMHTYAATGTYNVTLTVTDDAGATDAAGTTATVTETVRSLGDVFLEALKAPERVGISDDETKSTDIVVVGGGISNPQDATVTLSASVSGPVTVRVTQTESRFRSREGHEYYEEHEHRESYADAPRYRFKAYITCNGEGRATINWTATISAEQNSDTTNDTVTGTTSVRCY